MIDERIEVTFHPDDRSSYKYTLPDVVKISEKSINKDLENHSAKFLWFASLHARLVAKRDFVSGKLKGLMAEKEVFYRDQAESAGKKTTEASIRAMVDTDGTVQQFRSHLMDAENEVNMCQVIKDSFFHQQQCLIALGANMRQEMKAIGVDSIRE